MSVKFTPGPWQIVEHEIWDTRGDGQPGIPLYRRDAHYRRWGRVLADGEAEANAHLIAAAPDLYEAVELVVGSLKFDREDAFNAEVLRRIEAALSAARSEAPR